MRRSILVLRCEGSLARELADVERVRRRPANRGRRACLRRRRRGLAGRNDYRLGLLNGSRGTITAVDTRRSRVTVETTEGKTVDVSTRYLAAGHLTHGYATVHKAQDATVDTALLLVDDQSYREAAYTGLSRGRIANLVYVISDDTDAIEAHGLQREAPDELATLREAVRRSGAQELATRSGVRLWR